MFDVPTVVSLGIAAGALIFAGLTYSRGGKNEIRGNATERAATNTKLDFISNDLKDIKADNRRQNDEIRELRETHGADIARVNEVALHAVERAEAAHNRLDRAGIDMQH